MHKCKITGKKERNYVFLKNDVWDRIRNLKVAGVWIKCASYNKLFSLEDLALHLKVKPKTALKYVLMAKELDLIHEIILNEKSFFQANPSTFFHSDDPHDPRNSSNPSLATQRE